MRGIGARGRLAMRHRTGVGLVQQAEYDAAGPLLYVRHLFPRDVALLMFLAAGGRQRGGYEEE